MIVLALAAAGLIGARWLPAAARRPALVAAAVLVAVSALFCVVLGMRWQLLPVLVVAAIALVFTVTGLAARAPRWLAVSATVVGLLMLGLGPVADWAFPVPQFPAVTGPHPVGTTALEWTDPTRDGRPIIVQLWYPAAAAPSGPPAPYLGRDGRTVARALASHFGLPPFLLDGAARAHTHAVVDAPLTDGDEKYPVVLFSPGLGSVRTQNTAWAEELASRGYVVAGLDHPYDSAAIVLGDGTVIRSRVSTKPDDGAAVALTAVRAADLRFALTALGSPSRFAGRLALDHVAVTGHSIGGAAALQAARLDARFATVIDLDGYPFDGPGDPIRQPVLAVTSSTDRPYLERVGAVLDRGTARSYRLTVTGTAHVSFTDAPLYLPPVPALVGAHGRAGSVRMTVDITAAFLDRTLRNQGSDPAATLTKYGQMTVYH